MNRLLLVLLVLSGCGEREPTKSPVVPYDTESARIIRDLGIHRNSKHGLMMYVARGDLKMEEIDGKVKARLTDEKNNPQIFKAGMGPAEILREIERAEIDKHDPLVKRANEIADEMNHTDIDSPDGKALQERCTAEFEKTPGLREAVMRAATLKR